MRTIGQSGLGRQRVGGLEGEGVVAGVFKGAAHAVRHPRQLALCKLQHVEGHGRQQHEREPQLGLVPVPLQQQHYLQQAPRSIDRYQHIP